MDDDKAIVPFSSFAERLSLNMWHAQRNVERVTLYLQEPRHIEDISGHPFDTIAEECQIRRKGNDRLRTASVAIIMCLHLGVDPPDAPSRKDAPARLLSWIDPYKCGAHKAAMEVGLSTQRAYEKWQPKSKTRYKICTDPPIDDVRKVATNLRRISGNDRVLFHYNGHGVPKPTDNGEIWVFNKSFTQYIPLSIFDLQGWLDYPTIYIWETHSAETILHNYRRFGEDQKISWQSRFDRWQEEQRNLPPISSKMTDADQAEALGFPEKYPRYNDCVHLAACSAGQYLPMSNPHLPADLFTSCLTTPIRTSLAFHLSHSEHRNEYPENILDMIPGNLAERRTVLGELNWIFTAITDTIAFTSIETESFQKLFRQDLLLATLFRSFLLAQRVMSKFDVLPVSQPALKDTSKHELWQCWDQTMDMVLDYCRELIYVKESERALFCGRDVINRSSVFPFLVLIDFEHVLTYNETHQYNTFFTEQLQAFELWLDYGVDEGRPPLQLPMVLQVLLSQAHRVRALRLLARFLDFGRWAIAYSLAVGIFPYVLKLLQSNISDLRISLAFIWAKILAVDPSCQMELFNECIDESSSITQSPQQGAQQQSTPPPPPPAQPSITLKQSAIFLNHPPIIGASTAPTAPAAAPAVAPPPQLTMDKRALQISAQTGGRFQNNQNQAMEMQLQYAQQQNHQRPVEPSGGQHSPNPQPKQQQQDQQQAQGQQQQKQPAGIMKSNGQPAEKKTMLRFQYFLQLLGDPDIKPKQKTVAAFVLAQLTSNNFRLAQKELTNKGYMGMCTELMVDDAARSVKLLKIWILIGLGRLWSDYDVARWQGIRLMAHDKMILELSDDSAEVRAAAVFALGSLLRNSSRSNEHASAVEENLADELCAQCVFDSSVLVREELIVALQWFVFDFEKRFVKFLLDLSNQIQFNVPRRRTSSENENEEGLDIAAEMPSSRRYPRGPISEYTQPTSIRKKMSTSVFNTAVEETIHEDMSGNMHLIGYDTGNYAERVNEDFEFSIEYRQRAKLQILHLEAKTFNEAVARTWLSLLRLSLDPIERVARMAQKIVLRVEAGIPEMRASIDNTMAHLNKKMIARKSSRATVEMPRRPIGPSEAYTNMSAEISERLETEVLATIPENGGPEGIDFTQLNVQKQKERKAKSQIRRLQDESKVKFQVGSPADASGQHKNALSPVSSFTSETQSSELFSKDEESDEEETGEDRSATEERDVATTASGKTVKGMFRKPDFMDAATMEFTPRRTKAVPGDFTVKEESKTLRNVIENPIVGTQFVAWCSKVFVEPILHVITLDEEKVEAMEKDEEDEFMPLEYREKIKEIQKQDRKKYEEKRAKDKKEGKKERSQEDLVATTTTISDWAIHAMEGMLQSADIEGRDFKDRRYDECLWRVTISHPAKCVSTSKLRRCMYATDGQMMTIIRQDTDPRCFRRFDLTDSNPFCPSYVSQLILLNDMSREMVMACSSNGIVRIWDPCFMPWCDDYAKPPELVSASFALESQMKFTDETNKCLFDWNQQNGKLMCTGTRSVRIWDAHCEKVCQDVMYTPGSKQQAGPGAKLDKNTLPTAMSGNLDEEGNMIAVGYGDGRVDYFDMRMGNPKAARCTLVPKGGKTFDLRPPGIMHVRVNRKGYGTELFAGSDDGNIYKLQLRMFKESSPSIAIDWAGNTQSHMFVHEDSRILAAAAGGDLVIYDVAQNKQMARIEAQHETHDFMRKEKSASTFGIFSSQRKLSAAQLSGKMSTIGERKTNGPPTVLSLTMHQMRLLTVAGYSDNSVCVYGSPNPGLTSHYEKTQEARLAPIIPNYP
uniref:Raptor_N domain-containing protein n=1 Tax=Caenorhabditis tropicalis TaxID=1561998 RepID=A0A1I7TH01_9PELO